MAVLSNEFHELIGEEDWVGEEDWDDKDDEFVADFLKSVIVVLITKCCLEDDDDDDEKKEEDPVRELSIESVKNYAATTQDVLVPIPVQDVVDPILPVQDVVNPTPVKDKEVKDIEEEANSVKDDPNLLGISEKHSKEEKEKGKQIVEEKEKEDDDDEAPTNEEDGSYQRTPLEDTISDALSIAETKGITVKILRYHGVDGVTQVMEELFTFSEVTLFVVEEFFAMTMLKYVKKSVQMLGIPCVIYSANPKYYRYIWNDGSMGSMAHRSRGLECEDIIDSLVSGDLARKFAVMRRILWKRALPPDEGSSPGEGSN